MSPYRVQQLREPEPEPPVAVERELDPEIDGAMWAVPVDVSGDSALGTVPASIATYAGLGVSVAAGVIAAFIGLH